MISLKNINLIKIRKKIQNSPKPADRQILKVLDTQNFSINELQEKVKRQIQIERARPIYYLLAEKEYQFNDEDNKKIKKLSRFIENDLENIQCTVIAGYVESSNKLLRDLEIDIGRKEILIDKSFNVKYFQDYKMPFRRIDLRFYSELF